MVFAKHLREGIRRGEITRTVRIWQHCHVKVGGRYRMGDGHVVVTEIVPIDLGRAFAGVARCDSTAPDESSD